MRFSRFRRGGTRAGNVFCVTAKRRPFDCLGFASILKCPERTLMSDKLDRHHCLRVDRISPPRPISNRVRGSRVLSVEAVIYVERAILWPDDDGEQPGQSNHVQAARAQEQKGRRTRR